MTAPLAYILQDGNTLLRARAQRIAIDSSTKEQAIKKLKVKYPNTEIEFLKSFFIRDGTSRFWFDIKSARKKESEG